MLSQRTHKIYFLVSIFITLLVTGCANKTSPTGGPKDEIPPELLSATPSEGKLNYTDNEVILDFNEYVKTDKAKEQIIITPRIDGEYTIKHRRNRIIMTFDSAFSANTTYTINFRESIVDMTESNPAENLSLAFSTGSYIDSLLISGYVQNVLMGTPAKQATIALYPADDTTSLFNGLPVYFTESNDSGRYNIRNIKAGRYRVSVFKDANRNLEAEAKSESYGFYPDSLDLTENISNINMNLVNLDLSEFNSISARPSGTTYDIRFNKYITDYTLQPADTTILLNHYYADNERQTISIYNNQQISDSIKVYIMALDSIQQQSLDTVWVKFDETRRSPDDLTMEPKVEQIPVSNPVMKSTINFNKPIDILTKDSIYIYLDSLLILPVDSLHPIWNDTRTQLDLTLTFADSLFKTKENNESTDQQVSQRSGVRKRPPALILGRGAFIDVENDSSSSRSIDLPFVQPASLGILTINVTASTNEYFLQLINTEGKIVREHSSGNTIRFKNLPLGEYSLRAIIDVNQNGKWDPGNFYLNQLPENIVYFTTRNGTKNITIRANWDVTETFEF